MRTMLFGEVADAFALHVQHADHTILHDQRHRHLGTNLRVRRDVARIVHGVVHPNRFARLGCRTGNPFAQWNVVEIHALVVAFAETVAQQFPLRVHQHDAEGIVVDQRANGRRDLAQQLVQIQNRTEFLRQMRQHAERAVLVFDPPVEPGVVDRHRNPAREQPQQRAVMLGVGANPRGLHVDHAHQFATRDHRHREFGSHGIERADVARIACERPPPGSDFASPPRRP